MSDMEEQGEKTLTYALRFTERAQRDLDAATIHFAETASPEIAVAWREGLYETASLAAFPHTGAKPNTVNTTPGTLSYQIPARNYEATARPGKGDLLEIAY